MQLPPLAADAGIHCMPIPTPFAVGRVNCYLIDDEPLTLVDTGPNSGKALDELEQALAAHGRRVEDIELVLITHQHMDHLGLAQIVARRADAEIAALDRLVPWAAEYGRNMAADDDLADELTVRHGIPEDVRYALRSAAATFPARGAAAAAARPLADGGVRARADRRAPADRLRAGACDVGQRRGHAGVPHAVRGAGPHRSADQRRPGARGRRGRGRALRG